VTESKQTKAYRELLADMKDVMTTTQGRNVLNYFITQGGVGVGSFKGATNETMVNIGMQNLGLQIDALAQAASSSLNNKMYMERRDG